MVQVLIVGAGVVGLTLGQALKARNIPFEILERDPSSHHRGQGWAITLHWALQYLERMVPSDVLARVEACQVDPDVAKNDTGNFLFLNLEDGSVKFKIPPNKRWRINREKMRLALLEGIADRVHWGKQVVRTELAEDNGKSVTVDCSDGTSYTADLVVGIDGGSSMIRKILCPDNHETSQLPFRFIGVQVRLTEEQISPLRAIDPLLFQGCLPSTGTFMWFSILETPTADDPRYNVQLNISWPVDSAEDEVPSTNSARLATMKTRAQGFVSTLRDVVQGIPDGTPVLEIKLADWECREWNNHGAITLSGDAAHPMTMFRGEAANHGLLDAFHLVEALSSIQGGSDQKSALDSYETELRKRTAPAVRLSRQACFDAHSWDDLNENCAVLTRRQISA